MNQIELDKGLRKLRLSGMADTLEPRLVQAQAESMTHADLLGRPGQRIAPLGAPLRHDYACPRQLLQDLARCRLRDLRLHGQVAGSMRPLRGGQVRGQHDCIVGHL